MAYPDDPVTTAAELLRRPGLVVLTGPPGAGRSTLLRAVTAAVPGPAHTGGGLAMLATVPALALSRAVRARLPTHDIHLLAEAVRSRVRGGLLVLDDLQYADPATLAALPLIAAHVRVLAALRTPHRADVSALAGATWLAVPPLDREAALTLARRTAAPLDEASLHAVVDRAGGNPLAVTALARQAAAGRGTPGTDIDQVAYAIAAALADLTRPGRTALAALGLLGRPAPAGLLGPGAADLIAAGLAAAGPDGLLPTSTYVAETAAGLLDADARTDLHRRLAELTAPAEAARHLAAAGDHQAAYRTALSAADTAGAGDRAGMLLFACALPGVTVDPRVRLAAADAALAAGRPRAAARVLTTTSPLGVEADTLRGEALLQAGQPREARAAVQPVPDAAPAPVVAARDRVLLLTELATDPRAALDTADKLAARYPAPPPGVAAALAAVRAAHRVPGWDAALAAVAADRADPLTARWSAWLLVETLAADGRLLDSAAAATTAAQACAQDLAYGWQTRFLAAADWAHALHGAALPALTGPSPVATDTAPPAGPAAPEAGSAGFTAAGAGLVGSTFAGSAPAGSVPSASEPGGSVSAGSGPGGSAGSASVGSVPAGSAPGGPVSARSAPVGSVSAGSTSGGSAGSAPVGSVPAGSASGGEAELGPGRVVSGSASVPGLAGPAAGEASGAGVGGGSDGPTDGRGMSLGSAPGRRSTVYGSAFASAVSAAQDATDMMKLPLSAAVETAGPAFGTDAAQRRAADLTDRALPAAARGYATAAAALVEADTGLLAAARERLDNGPDHPATAWVSRETAWLDGQPDRAAQAPPDVPPGLLDGLHAITARWAAYDTGAASAAAIPDDVPAAARRTLLAWATGTGFAAAADAWTPTALREQVRCLIAAGLHETEPDRAVAALLAAEELADAAGLTVLAGRARRGLRRHRVHRDTRSPRSGSNLTNRELDVLRLVAAGEPTRRIAGQLGISAETVDTHIRAGMRKLGARTRTEAAARAFATDHGEDGR